MQGGCRKQWSAVAQHRIGTPCSALRAPCLSIESSLHAQAEEGGQQEPKCYSLAHKFVLEAAEVTETPRTTVTLQLLGPHTVK